MGYRELLDAMMRKKGFTRKFFVRGFEYYKLAKWLNDNGLDFRMHKYSPEEYYYIEIFKKGEPEKTLIVHNLRDVRLEVTNWLRS